MFKTSYAEKDRRGLSAPARKGLKKRLIALALAFLFLTSCLPAGTFSLTAEAADPTGATGKKIVYPQIKVRSSLPENYHWIDSYAYNVDTDHCTITLLRCDAKGEQTVYGCALIDNIPYRIVLGPRCFKDCPALTGLSFLPGSGAAGQPKEAASIKVQAPADMSRMFSGDVNLKTLNLSGIDFSAATDLSYMAEGCSNVTALTLGEITPGLALTSASVSCEGMFKDCASASKIDVSRMTTRNVCSMAYMFAGCKKAAITWSKSFDTSHVTSMAHMFDGAAAATLTFDQNFVTTSVLDMSYMFAGTSCPLDLRYFHTEQVRKIAGFFAGHRGNGAINIGGDFFYFPEVRDLSYFFALDYGTPKITFSKHWSTANVTNFSHMFAGYGRPAGEKQTGTVSFSTFLPYLNVYKGKNFSGMFSRSGFTDINISTWKDARPENITSLFEDARWVTDINVTGLYTMNIKSFGRMFADCWSLKNVTGLSTWQTYNCEYLSYMFYNCKSLENLQFTGVSISRARYMTQMFDGCVNAKKLEFSYIDTSSMGVFFISAYNFAGENDFLVKKNRALYINGSQVPEYSLPNLFAYSCQTGFKEGPVYAYPVYNWQDVYENPGKSLHTEGKPMYVSLVTDLSYTHYNDVQTFHYEGDAGPMQRCYAESLKTAIHSVPASEATEEIRRTWFCPAAHRDPYSHSQLQTLTDPANTNSTVHAEDTNYYEIYGWIGKDCYAYYEPSQEQWDATIRSCTLSIDHTATYRRDQFGVTQEVKDCSPKDFQVYGFQLRSNPVYTVTLKNPVYNLTGSSGTVYSMNTSRYPIFPKIAEKTFSYGQGHAGEHLLPALKQKGFFFLGWFDESGSCVSSTDGTCYPNNSSNQVLTPRFLVQETRISLSTGTPPDGFNPLRAGISIRPEQKGLWHGGSGSYYAYFTVRDGLFALPEAVITPYKTDNCYALMDGWLKDSSFNASGTKTLSKSYIFDLEQDSPSYTATWTIKAMTVAEKAALQDEPPIEKTLDLMSGIDPENPDAQKTEEAMNLYNSLSEEEQKAIPEEEATTLKQAYKIVEQQRQLDEKEKEITALQDDVNKYKAAAQKAQQDLKKATDETARQKAAAEKSAIEAQKAVEEAAKQKAAADRALDDVVQARQDAAVAAERESQAKEALAKADANAADAQAKYEEAQKAATEARQAELIAAAKQEEAEKAAEKANAAAENAAQKCQEAQQSLADTKAALAVAESRQQAAEESEAKKSATLDQVNAEKMDLELKLTSTEAERQAAVEKYDRLASDNQKQQEESAAKLAQSSEEIEKTKQEVSDLEKKLAVTNATIERMTQDAETAQKEIQSSKEAAAESERKAEEARNDARKAKESEEAAKDDARKARESEEAAKDDARKARESEEAAKDDARKARESEEAAKDDAEKAREREQNALNEAKDTRERAEEYRNTRDSIDETEQIQKLNEMNASLEQELADSKRMLQELLAKSKTPANPYDTGWSFEPGTATSQNQQDTNYDYIYSGGKGTGSSGHSGTGGYSPSGNSSSTGSGRAYSYTDKTYPYSSGITAGNSSSSGTGSSTSSGNGRTYPYAGSSAASKGGSSSSENASSAGRASDTDEFLLSWLTDTDDSRGSGQNDSSGGNSANPAGYSDEYNRADGISADGNDVSTGSNVDETDPDKAAGSLGSGTEGSRGIDFSSPLATLLSIVGIGAATAAAVAFTWRRKRPVNRASRRTRRPH